MIPGTTREKKHYLQLNQLFFGIHMIIPQNFHYLVMGVEPLWQGLRIIKMIIQIPKVNFPNIMMVNYLFMNGCGDG